MRTHTLAVVTILMFTLSATAGAEKSLVADAAMRGDRAAIQKLLAQKADVNTPQADGATALHWA
ncbi:MAG TPA: hypothetical protein VKB36_16255, partial [Vicinamibacterales bacterium]|nr:hypothetical protein [Vicinamibacterales bacterium]